MTKNKTQTGGGHFSMKHEPLISQKKYAQKLLAAILERVPTNVVCSETDTTRNIPRCFKLSSEKRDKYPFFGFIDFVLVY